MARRIVISVILAGVSLVGGITIYKGLVALRTEVPVVEPDRVALTVNAVTLQPVTVSVPVDGFGTARADRMATLGAEVTGQVIWLSPGLRDGVLVGGGDELLRVDEREYRARLERASSQVEASRALLEQLDVEESNVKRLIATADEELKLTEREYSRVLDLFERGTSNPRELDAARLTLKRTRRTLLTLEGQLDTLPTRRTQQRAMCKLQEAEVTLANLNLERCTIRAPFAGRVEQLRVELGEQVGPGHPLLSVLDPGLIEVPLELPVSWRDRVQVGGPARLMLENRVDVVWTGTVARISPSADESTRTFAVYVEVLNAEQAVPIVPGMFVRARIDGPTLTDVLVVPRGCVRRQHVFVCEDGAAYRREVRPIEHVLDQTVIEGLAVGDVVITSNLDALTDGTPVIPVLVANSPSPAVAVDAAIDRASPASAAPNTP